ncbi:MAG: 3-phosphoglycerate dehydrogenase [Lentihominibacter sp.]
MYKISTLNKISPAGLARLTDEYTITENVQEANSIILRSYNMYDMDLPADLMAVGRAGAGVNNIPLDKCAQQGIVVFNAPGANANAVKELCLAGMFLAARNITEGFEWAKTLIGTEDVGKAVEKGKGQFAGTEIKGKTLGVIGLGAIGVLVANAAESLGMNVIGHDPFLSVKAAHSLSNTIDIADSLKDLYPQCDYITIHVPVMDSTKAMINAEAFAQMKDGVVFLNFARDKLVNDSDLLSAIDSGKVKKYITDFPNDTVIGKKGILALPHLGASSAEAEDNCAVMAVDQVMDYLENGNIVNSVNMPACTLGPKKGTRISIISKADAGVLEKVAAICDGDVINKVKGEYAYTLAETTGDVDESAITGEGIIRVRILR